MLKIFSIFCVILFFTACEIIDLTDLSLSTYPSERNQIVLKHDSLWIEFSEDLQKTKAEGFLQVQGPMGLILGDLTWVDRKLRFYPYEPLTNGFRYNFIYQGMVNTHDGRNYQVNLNIPFYAGTNSAQAILSSYTPVSGSITGVFEPIVFNFSKTIDIDSFEQNFSINPSADLDFLWENSNNRVVITPRQKWSNQKLHRWKITRKVTDTEAIPIAMEYSQTFLVQDDVTPPEILTIQPTSQQSDGSYSPLPGLGLTDLDNSNDIYFQFNEAINFASLNSSFSIKPDMDGHIKQISPQEFVYVKGSNFEPEKEYTLTFKEGLNDLSGNAIPEDIIYFFVPAVPEIQVLSVNIKHNSGNYFVDNPSFNLQDMIKIHPPYVYFGVSEPDYSLQFVITLDQSFTEEEVTAKQNFIQGISCETTFPPGTPSPFLYNSNWNASGNILTIMFKDFKIASDSEPIYYHFKILGGSISSANSAGSYLLDNIFFYFNAQGMNP